MLSCLNCIKVVLLVFTLNIVFTSCEDDVIIAPKGQSAAGSYGRMGFPDSTNTPVIITNDNPEVF